MELVLFRPKEFEELYNCSFYNVSDIPLERRQHKEMGFIFIACFFFFELCMFVNTFLTGYLAVTGAVYCTHPTLIYFCGTFALTCWACESTAEVVLAFNRCTAICSTKWEEFLFSGYKTWLWMSIPNLYALYWALFTKPLLFSGIYMSWFFNPHVGYYDDFGLIYNNHVQVEHNYFVIVGLTATYMTFAVLLYCKSKKISGQNAAQHNSSHKMIFLQVVMISMVNAVAASVYIVMQYIRISQFIIYLGSIAWVLAHGFPPVIYLVMNKTMRQDAIKMSKNFFGFTQPEYHSNYQRRTQASRSTHQLAGVSDKSNNSTIGAAVH